MIESLRIMPCNSTHKRHFAFFSSFWNGLTLLWVRLLAFKHTTGRDFTGLSMDIATIHCLLVRMKNLLRHEGEIQTYRSFSTVRECIKLDLLLSMTLFFCSQWLQNRVDSWHLHFVANTHPCYNTLNEHISLQQFTHPWGQRMYLTSLVNAYSILCMLCQNIFWAVQQCLHSEHDKIFLYRLIISCSAVLWNKHVPLWPLWCSLLFAPLCHSSIHRPDLWWLPHSCLFFFAPTKAHKQ